MTNLCTRFIWSAAERIAADAGLPESKRVVFRDNAATILHQQLLAMLPDRMADSGCLRFYPPPSLTDQRAQRDQRIRALLASGMAPELVAAEAGCSRRHVYNVRRRLAACRPPP